MAQSLASRRTTKTQLINDGFNRHTFRDQAGLPSWFLDDEAKHYRMNLPVTKEAVAAMRARQRALDARPIKKIAEAKARKKIKAAQHLAKAMKKAEGINESTDISERDKAAQIQRLMAGGSKQALGKKSKPKVKVVVAKGANKGVKGRPKGVKGKYLMVDARMRKEVRTLMMTSGPTAHGSNRKDQKNVQSNRLGRKSNLKSFQCFRIMCHQIIYFWVLMSH
jgi:AdoMet-dependent rRNA methyltransferase SPB1